MGGASLISFSRLPFLSSGPSLEQSITGNQGVKGVLGIYMAGAEQSAEFERKDNSLITDPLGLTGNSELTPRDHCVMI